MGLLDSARDHRASIDLVHRHRGFTITFDLGGPGVSGVWSCADITYVGLGGDVGRAVEQVAHALDEVGTRTGTGSVTN